MAFRLHTCTADVAGPKSRILSWAASTFRALKLVSPLTDRHTCSIGGQSGGRCCTQLWVLAPVWGSSSPGGGIPAPNTAAVALRQSRQMRRQQRRRYGRDSDSWVQRWALSVFNHVLSSNVTCYTVDVFYRYEKPKTAALKMMLHRRRYALISTAVTHAALVSCGSSKCICPSECKRRMFC